MTEKEFQTANQSTICNRTAVKALYLCFNMCLSVMLDNLSCSSTYISFPTRFSGFWNRNTKISLERFMTVRPVDQDSNNRKKQKIHQIHWTTNRRAWTPKTTLGVTSYQQCDLPRQMFYIQVGMDDPLGVFDVLWKQRWLGTIISKVV